MAVIDVFLVILVLGGALDAVGTSGLTPVERAVAVAACVLFPLLVLVRRWRPMATAVAVWVVVVVVAVVVPLRPTTVGVSVGGDGNGHLVVVIWATLFAVGAALPWRRSLPAAVALVATLSLPRVVGQVDGQPYDPSFLVLPLLASVGVYLASLATRSRRLAVARVAQYAAELERSRDAEARAAVAEERLRIARELHDIVGHHLSLVAIQLAAADATFESRPGAAREAITTARDSGLAALAEMRTVVGALREDPSSPAATGLAGVPALLGSLREVGLDVTSSVVGEPRELSAIVDLAAFRIVQESLTNVLRHSGAATADLGLEWGDEAVSITVRDPGRGSGAVAVTGGGGGHGLRGMAERVAAVNGRIATGPLPGGGYRVSAVLPYAPEPAGAGAPGSVMTR